MKNKFVIALALFLGLIFIVSSCDTRDDYFYEHCDEPVINFISDDGEYESYPYMYTVVYLHMGETKKVRVEFIDEYKEISEVSHYLEFQTLGYGKGLPYYEITDENGINIIDSDHLGIEFDDEDNTLIFSDKTESIQAILEANKNAGLGYNLFCIGGHTLGTALYCNRIYFTVYNILGKKGYGVIQFFLNYDMPIPVITIQDTKERLEKNITVTPTDTINKIVNYEYCIDGKVSNAFGFEFEERNKDAKIKAGEAAWNGTYITATSLNSINHAFQTIGNHTIYVRCQDDLGCWSDWISTTIDVE